ncbi:Autoantigen NGP-1, putative [Brugia malayi]|uniref:Nucleolar GTP-binding protein 2 n=3 Tax=Brugia TaxID=6278 RepID=A0A0H5S461_BRUMA|nr:Autoantigen NGP-1, putative [Brugia malayi]CRZ23001.1 BMA-NGP-1, isoform b [Brugia malayi]VIO95506.1 Autoantigen NGP-1, putative [Brugia malayi]
MAKKRSSLKKSRSDSGSAAMNTKKFVKRTQGTRNGLTFKKGEHSLNPDRKAKGDHFRSRATINRLRMYKNFKPIRDARGKIVRAAPYQEKLPSGTVARVEPHRKWFGNTRVVGQEQLQKFQENLGKALQDPFQVVMRQTKLPISLLTEKAKQQRVHVLDTESFEYTFGKKALRKKPKVKVESLETLCGEVVQRTEQYDEATDSSLIKNAIPEAVENSNPLFKAGQSNRVWGELYKVIDSSDVVVEVVDGRDPMGTRCLHIEQFLRKEKPHKHLILVLNKVDLVPTWITKKWLTLLSQELPTVAFHASMQHSFGKGTLINLLRQFANLHKDRQQISVGFIGYPNVGKSSMINTLRSKRVCKTAPIAGETKVWQYVSLMRRIYMIDCPGVVYPQGDSETQIILKGVVRVENVKDPINHVQGVLDRVREQYLLKTYSIDPWNDVYDFLTKICVKTGRLLKGGEPDWNTAAKIVLNDFQRGRLPYFVLPPGCELQNAQGHCEDNVKCAEEIATNECNDSNDIANEESNAADDHNNSDDDDDNGTLTDLGSTCSGLTNLSDLDDLDFQLPEAPEGTIDAGAEPIEKNEPKLEKRRARGKRAGKKLSEKRNRLKHGKPFDKCSGIVEFGLSEKKKETSTCQASAVTNINFIIVEFYILVNFPISKHADLQLSLHLSNYVAEMCVML